MHSIEARYSSVLTPLPSPLYHGTYCQIVSDIASICYYYISYLNREMSQRQSIQFRSAPCLRPQISFTSRLKPSKMLHMIYRVKFWPSPRRIAVSISSFRAQISLSSAARLTCTIPQSWTASPSGKKISLPFRVQCPAKLSFMTIERISWSERGEIILSMWSRLLRGSPLAQYG